MIIVPYAVLIVCETQFVSKLTVLPTLYLCQPSFLGGWEDAGFSWGDWEDREGCSQEGGQPQGR